MLNTIFDFYYEPEMHMIFIFPMKTPKIHRMNNINTFFAAKLYLRIMARPEIKFSIRHYVFRITSIIAQVKIIFRLFADIFLKIFVNHNCAHTISSYKYTGYRLLRIYSQIRWQHCLVVVRNLTLFRRLL